MPRSVARYIARLRSRSKPIAEKRAVTAEDEPKSFGVYVGGFSNPPTTEQTFLLSRWDVLVLDPMEDGVLHALSTCGSSSTHIIGRLGISTLAKSDGSSSHDDVIRAIDIIAQTLATRFMTPQDMASSSSSASPFTGVLLAGFEAHFQPPVLNEIARYIRSLGLDLWLEMGPPAYPTERECRDINMELVRGVVCRNSTIRPDGDIQDYFQMTSVRTAMRAIAAQRIPHGPPLMIWETVDDDVELQYAVVQRSFNWCRYNSALCWIGSAAALTDAAVSAAASASEKPLGALMWLKNEDNMRAHDSWRSNNQV